MFHEAISSEQFDILKKLCDVKRVTDSFYLAGGTALALQLGHRKSYDFDFFSKDKFDSEYFSDLIIKDFKGKVSSFSDDTVNGSIKNINISFFIYPYKLISDLKEFHKIKLAGIEDLASMKCSAIMQRGTKRDLYDIYEILKIIQPIELKNYLLEKYGENGNSFYH